MELILTHPEITPSRESGFNLKINHPHFNWIDLKRTEITIDGARFVHESQTTCNCANCNHGIEEIFEELFNSEKAQTIDDFEVGDVVEVVELDYRVGPHIGLRGVIICKDSQLTVRFDADFDDGHNASGQTEEYRGVWYSEGWGNMNCIRKVTF